MSALQMSALQMSALRRDFRVGLKLTKASKLVVHDERLAHKLGGIGYTYAA
jgi:hypothetical protein